MCLDLDMAFDPSKADDWFLLDDDNMDNLFKDEEGGFDFLDDIAGESDCFHYFRHGVLSTTNICCQMGCVMLLLLSITYQPWWGMTSSKE